MRTLSLAKAPLHRPLKLVASELDAVLGRRLSSLGLRHGARVSVVQKLAGGGRVVAVAGARVALGRPLLAALTVEEADAA